MDKLYKEYNFLLTIHTFEFHNSFIVDGSKF